MRMAWHGAAVFLLFAGTATAQVPAPEPAPAGTIEGAKAVTAGLAPYVGQRSLDQGTVKVEPDPAGYRVTVDAGPILRSLARDAFSLEVTPYSFVIGRRDDGNWNYFSNGSLDLTARVIVDGKTQVVDYDIGSLITKGVFSPALAAFLSMTGSAEGASMTTAQEGEDVAARFGRIATDISGRPAEGGAVDATVRQTIDGFEETVSVKASAETPPGGINITFKAAGMNTDATMAAVRSRPMADLYAFLIAHPDFVSAKPDRSALAASQGEFKAKLRDMLPLWKRLESGYSLRDISVGTQFGGVTAKTLTGRMTADGISRAGAIAYSFGFAGLDMSSPAVPGWASSLIPREAELRLRIDNLDLQTPADIVLADLDLTRPQPLGDEAQARIGEAFTANPPRFVIEPSRLKSRDLDIAMAGSVVVSQGKPAVTMDISAAGIDKAISTLQTAAQDNPDLNQAVGGLSIAKGFGKTLPDGRTQWIVDAASDGSVKVNGFQIKGPEPVASPDAPGDGDDGGIVPDGEKPLDQAPTDDNALPDSPPTP